MDLKDIRMDYTLNSLEIDRVNQNPFEQFKNWMSEAQTQKSIIEPTAMHLATASTTARPSTRVVLLKELDAKGFIFFGNYNSRKGKHLLENPFACLNFFWQPLQRQVRIEGHVEKISAQESTAYYITRPIGSQIGAIASPQSSEIANREILEDNVQRLKLKYEHTPPERPEHWGGFRLIPIYFEFWQGRSSRLHDRIVYEKNDQYNWKIKRLAP